MTDMDFLEAKVRGLELENQRLRLALRDDFAMAALTGLLMHYGDVGHIVDRDGRTSIHFAAFDHAEQMLVQRGKFHSQPEKKANDKGNEPKRSEGPR